MAAKLIALVIPLGLDTFGVALALGVSGLPAGRRERLSVWFALFDAGMPQVGAALGRSLGHTIGAVADYVAVLLAERVAG
jgi:putative Mn2+ efflux pump MntP